MKNQSKIAVVGAGPAGASLAIRLAQRDFDVTLIERDKFPRHKLCGEFISPECLEHFRELGILGEMLGSGGERLTETVFYSAGGKSVSVASEWLGSAVGALSLSRAAMDLHLLNKAKSVGVKVLEETQTTGLLFENQGICGVKVKSKTGETCEIAADLIFDATGRANVLGKMAQKSKVQSSKFKVQSSKLVGFKTHLAGVEMEKNRCEIYFFAGGYGGLSYVENDVANHCFLIDAAVVKKFGGNADAIVEDVIFKNPRALETMKNAAPVMDWLAVSVDNFGAKELNPAGNLFSVGDAAAFIDPFTGSGMLLALESAEILAKVVADNRFAPENIALAYQIAHRRKFQNRLRVCAVLRRAAFMPNFAGYVISALSLSRKTREFVARATRQSLLQNK